MLRRIFNFRTVNITILRIARPIPEFNLDEMRVLAAR